MERECGKEELLQWGFLTPYYEGDWIFSVPQAGLMPPEGDSLRVASGLPRG